MAPSDTERLRPVTAPVSVPGRVDVASIFDDPRLIASDRFKRQERTLEHTDKADLQRVVANLLIDPHIGDRQQDGRYALTFGPYTVRYSLLSEAQPQTTIYLDDVRVF